MRALGEMAIEQPVAGSFSKYANDYISPLAGYITGWNYWFLWVVTCMAEITAAGIYMQYWFPDIPRWTWALLALLLMSAFNFLSVKVFGELEFWFALIKIVTIICMIIVELVLFYSDSETVVSLLVFQTFGHMVAGSQMVFLGYYSLYKWCYSLI